jgi:hypothetical protein
MVGGEQIKLSIHFNEYSILDLTTHIIWVHWTRSKTHFVACNHVLHGEMT